METSNSTKRKASAIAPSTESLLQNKISPISVAAGTDSLSRVAAVGGRKDKKCIATAGRGSITGWTRCPLCGEFSKKKYAYGRGISNHLRDVHTPWNPSKLAQKIHRRKFERQEREKHQRARKRLREENSDANQESNGSNVLCRVPFEPLVAWTPTAEEEEAWTEKIFMILEELEGGKESKLITTSTASSMSDATEVISENTSKYVSSHRNVDKSGNVVLSYRDSLPPFLMAASNGDIKGLQQLVDEARRKDEEMESECSISDDLKGKIPESVPKDKHRNVRKLLDTRDRHKSTAEHWAAGKGDLACLRFLYELKASLTTTNLDRKLEDDFVGKHRVRRRDGKTCLHYAARNGHIDCIRYLLDECRDHQKSVETMIHSVDERSGEGSTPLHLACYGGHPEAVKYLVKEQGADPLSKNDWGCSCAHWVAMTISKSEIAVRELCRYLSEECGVSFVEQQGQGHTALHKAAHRRNRHVIQWMADPQCNGGAGLSTGDKEKAGAPDPGGHKPSDIWRNMGGEDSFAEWMSSNFGW